MPAPTHNTDPNDQHTDPAPDLSPGDPASTGDAGQDSTQSDQDGDQNTSA